MNWQNIFQQQVEKANPELFKPQPICHTNPFTSIKLWPHPSGGTIVEWSLVSTFQEPPPHHYELQIAYGESAEETEWETVAEGEDTFLLVHESPETYTNLTRAIYRLRLLVGDKKQPTAIYQTLIPSKPYFDLRSRKIIRRKFQIVIQNLKRASGTPGLLYKRRYYGPKCPRCANILTGEPVDGGCGVCYGTGIIGGYYQPLPFLLSITEQDFQHELNAEGLGTVQLKTIKCLGPAFPDYTHGDIWRNLTDNTFWWINQVAAAESFRGYPVINNIILSKIPATSPLYHLPDSPQISLDFLQIPVNLT